MSGAELGDLKEDRTFLRTWHFFLVLGLLGLLVLFYRGLYGNPSYIPPVIIDTPAPKFTAQEMFNAEEISLSQLKGKVVVLNFWASWCQECKLEHPFLLELNRRFSQDPNFVMIGVNYQDKEDLARQYLKEHGNNFQHIRDTTGTISIDYGIYGIPETFVIDPAGVIRYKTIGPVVGNSYRHLVEKVIEPLLSGKGVS